MIWSSLARNRSPDPVVLCFFGRIATSDATTESWLAIRRNPENEIARFRCPKHQNPAIAKQSTKTNAILAQSLSRSSRTTNEVAHRRLDIGHLQPQDADFNFINSVVHDLLEQNKNI